MATDACEDGYGVVSGEFPPSVVSAWERRLERHRFRFMSAVQGRKHALADLDPFSAAETVEDFSSECEGRYAVFRPRGKNGAKMTMTRDAERPVVWRKLNDTMGIRL